MVRAVLYIFLAIIVITVVRSIVGALAKGFSAMIEPERQPRAPSEPRNAGELKRDPICGTYVSPATSVKREIKGQTVHFCSQACSDKYRG